MALIPQGYFESVVSLGELGLEYEFSHLGTGFLYAHALQKREGRTPYRPFLVTNKHVADRVSDVRYNRATDRKLSVAALSELGPEWKKHEKLDLAVMPLTFDGPLLSGRSLMSAEIFLGDVGTPDGNEWGNITEGLGVFLLGFPLGLIGSQRNYAVVRGGVIARIQDYTKGEGSTFLIDAPAFPGNSGGPVILRIETSAVGGTKPISRALLIGMISHYVPYRDVTISKQTGEARSVLVENSGLALVVPIQEIMSFLEESFFRSGSDAKGVS